MPGNRDHICFPRSVRCKYIWDELECQLHHRVPCRTIVPDSWMWCSKSKYKCYGHFMGVCGRVTGVITSMAHMNPVVLCIFMWSLFQQRAKKECGHEQIKKLICSYPVSAAFSVFLFLFFKWQNVYTVSLGQKSLWTLPQEKKKHSHTHMYI